MKYLNTTFILMAFLTFSSCTQSGTEKSTKDQIETTEEPEMDVVKEDNALLLRNEIEDYRQTIENTKADIEKGTLELSTARAEISQNWKKLEFFKKGNKVVRIKTYPKTEKESKTKEFYFNDDELVFALIANEGVENDESVDKEMGPAFYYHEGELIISADLKITEASEEMKNEMEQGTKLQNEATEYLRLVYESQD